MKQKRISLGLLVGGALLSLFGANAKADSMSWERSWSNAQSIAQTQNKPIMIDFYTDWCGWCKRLDRTTYNDSEVLALSEQFVPLKLDAERGGESVANRYDVHSFPNIVFLRPDGTVIHRFAGYIAGPGYAANMKYVLALFDYSHRFPQQRVNTDPQETANTDRTRSAGNAPVAQQIPIAAPPQPLSGWSSLPRSQASRDMQAKLDAAAAKRPNGVMLEGSSINEDPNGLLIVGEAPVAVKPLTKSVKKVVAVPQKTKVVARKSHVSKRKKR